MTIFTDDLDGLPADDTVDFGVDGRLYQIDLSQEHADEFRKVLKKYAKAGRLLDAAAPVRRRRRRSVQLVEPAVEPVVEPVVVAEPVVEEVAKPRRKRAAKKTA